jgi:uncharacterized protein YjbI with pentapeptide repeats
MRMRPVVCVIAALFGTVNTEAQAQAEGRRLALVIGISGYAPLPRLALPFTDADTVSKVLAGAGKFKVTQIMDPTAASFRSEIAEFVETVQPNDIVVIYYAGHGVQRQNRNYLLPIDFPADVGQLNSKAIAIDELLNMIDTKQPAIKLLILDACRNSPLPGADNGLAEMDSRGFGAGTRIEFAAFAGRTAADGLYARHLVAELVKPGQDVDGVFRNVRARVVRDSRGQQTPSSTTQLTVNFFFVPAQMASPGEALAVLQRVASTMPRAELGQTAALQSLIQQDHSLAGTELLEGLAFVGGAFNRIDLSRARLAGAQFDRSQLQDATLTGATLSFATMNHTNLSRATMNNASFGFVEADSALARETQAAGSTWFAARARAANFAKSNLRGAGFMLSDLRNADFTGADLTGAVFVANDLRGAQFTGATIANTDFTGSLIDASAFTPAQRRGACQMNLPVVPAGTFGHVLTVVVIEPIPNNRFSGGYEYSRFHESQHIFRFPPAGLGPCQPRTLTDNGWFPIWQSRGQDQLRNDLSFRLTQKLLQQAGRRSEIRSRIQQQLEWAYPFPTGELRVTIATTDVPPEQRALAGSWRLSFQADGRLLLQRDGSPATTGRYEKRPPYKLSISVDSQLLGCGPTPVDYNWYLTPQNSLKLIAYPGDSCVNRSLVLQKMEWQPSLPARGG